MLHLAVKEFLTLIDIFDFVERHDLIADISYLLVLQQLYHQ